MNHLKISSITLLTLLNTLICTGQKNLRKDTIEINGAQRSYHYYLPGRIIKNPKLIFVLHGATMTSTFMHQATGGRFTALAEQFNDAIIVYPQGYGNTWNDCRKKGTYPSKLEQIDDVAYLLGLREKYRADYGIPEENIFVVGFSNGGHMCYKLAKIHPDKFQAFAVVGANLPVSDNNDCPGSKKPVSLLLVNGTSDPVNPYWGGEVKANNGVHLGRVMATSETISYWLGLMPSGQSHLKRSFWISDTVERDNSSVHVSQYSFSKIKKDITLVKVINGGHHFNNTIFSDWPDFLGNLNRDIDLPKLIMAYFNDPESIGQIKF